MNFQNSFGMQFTESKYKFVLFLSHSLKVDQNNKLYKHFAYTMIFKVNRKWNFQVPKATRNVNEWTER